MTGRRNAARLAGVAALTAPLAIGLLAAAPAAWASGSITDPGPGDQTSYTSDTIVRISATASGLTPTDLTLTDPVSGVAQTIASAAGSVLGSTALSYALDTTCWTYPISSCSSVASPSPSPSPSPPPSPSSTPSSAPAPNGTWTIGVTGGSPRSFVLTIAPHAPAGLTARGSGARRVTLSWARGAEPDLTTYTLYDGTGAVLTDGIEPAAACHSSSCSAVWTAGSAAPGKHDFALTAHRKLCPTCLETLESATAVVSTTLPAPSPAAHPSTARSTGPSGSTGSRSTPATGAGGPAGRPSIGPGPVRATSSPASTVRPGRTIAPLMPLVASTQPLPLGFSHFSPSVGVAVLPPLPETAAPLIAAGALPGTYPSALPDPAALPAQALLGGQQVGPGEAAFSQVSQVVSNPVDDAQLARGIAGALVLLLAAAHLRRFLTKGT